MKNRKIIIWKTAIFLLFFLGICTVVSYHVEQWLLPNVTRIQGTKGDSRMNDPISTTLVPSNCVYLDPLGNSYVMTIQNREGIWGMEHFVHKQIIQVVEEKNYQTAVIGFDRDTTSLAAYPSRSLMDGEVVKVVEK